MSTWTPTKPRGPIAAMYNSPGPMYKLPGSTGAKAHDPRLHCAPSYTLSGRHGKFSEDSSPGPAYNPDAKLTRKGKCERPSYSLYSRPRDYTLFQTPGPGKYHVDPAMQQMHRRPPAYTMGNRTKGFQFDKTPGPNTYMLPAMVGSKCVDVRTCPAYSLRSRSKFGGFAEDYQKTPGPGTYSTINTSVYKQSSPHVSLTGRNQLPGDCTRKPGPGAYSPEKNFDKKNPGGVTMGIRHSQYIAPLIIECMD